MDGKGRLTIATTAETSCARCFLGFWPKSLRTCRPSSALCRSSSSVVATDSEQPGEHSVLTPVCVLVQDFEEHEMAKKAGLLKVEIVVLRMYTGPM